jgi:hypothetical protein
MILSELLSKRVRCGGDDLGFVIDARFVVRGAVSGALAEAELVGLVVGPHEGAAFLGYERTQVQKPALLSRYFAWRQRGSFLVDWDDVEDVGDTVELRTGFTKWSSRIDA